MQRLIFILRKIAYFFTSTRLPKVIGKNCQISPTVIFQGKTRYMKIGNDVRIFDYVRFFCNKSASIEIGDKSIISWNAIISTTKMNGFVKIGKNCSVNSFCIISGSGGITIGDDVRIAHHVSIIAGNHIFSDPNVSIVSQGIDRKGITIHDDVWIAADCHILDGVTIGKGAVIAAGSIVNKDVEPYTVVGGVPAKFLKKRGE